MDTKGGAQMDRKFLPLHVILVLNEFVVSRFGQHFVTAVDSS